MVCGVRQDSMLPNKDALNLTCYSICVRDKGLMVCLLKQTSPYMDAKSTTGKSKRKPVLTRQYTKTVSGCFDMKLLKSHLGG